MASTKHLELFFIFIDCMFKNNEMLTILTQAKQANNDFLQKILINEIFENFLFFSQKITI